MCCTNGNTDVVTVEKRSGVGNLQLKSDGLSKPKYLVGINLSTNATIGVHCIILRIKSNVTPMIEPKLTTAMAG